MNTPDEGALETLKRAAEELAGVAAELGLGHLATAIAADQQRRLKDQRLRVMILGEIKHGKSTLINALAGEDMLPVGVTPTTGRVVAVRPGPVSGRFVADAGGETRALEAAEFGDYVRGKRDLGDGRLEVQIAGDTLPGTIELVDTPGLNDVERFRGAASRGELPRADVLLLVLDATQALTRTELEMLRDALTAVGGLGASGARLEVVINRIDLVSETDREVVVGHLREQLHDLIGTRFEPFLTDAKAASAGASPDAFGVTEVARLRGRLAELAESRDEILPARMRSSLLSHAKTLRYNALIQARAVTLEAERLRFEMDAVQGALDEHAYDLAKLRQTLVDGRAAILEASLRRSEEFRRSLQSDALGQIDDADLRSLTDVLPGAIQAAFLDFARAEARRIREALEQMTDRAIRTHGEHARRRLLDASLRLGFAGPSIYVEPPSVAIEAGMIALGIVGTAVMYFGNMVTGMVMTIASPLATMLLRERSVRDARAQARQIIPTALARAESALTDTVRRAVESYVVQLDDHLVSAAETIGEQLVATLTQAEARLEAAAAAVDAAVETATDAAASQQQSTHAKASENEGESARADEAAAAAEVEAPAEAEGDDAGATATEHAPAPDATARPRAARPTADEPVEIPDPVGEGGVAIDPERRARERRARAITEHARGELRRIEARIETSRAQLEAIDLGAGTEAQR